jgi:hypothetical protein
LTEHRSDDRPKNQNTKYRYPKQQFNIVVTSKEMEELSAALLKLENLVTTRFDQLVSKVAALENKIESLETSIDHPVSQDEHGVSTGMGIKRASFDFMLDSWINYCKRNKTNVVPKAETKLNGWVRDTRKAYRNFLNNEPCTMTAERDEKLKAANFPFNLDVAQLKTPKKHPYRIGTKAPKKQQSTLKASKKNLRNLDDKEEPNAVEPIETPTERTLRSGTKSMTIPTKRTHRSGPNTQKKLKAVELENLAKDSEAVEPANYAEAVASNAEAVSPANSEAAEIANLEAAESANVAKDAEILEIGRAHV